MKKIQVLALAMCLIGLACGPTTNTPAGSDNQTGQDPNLTPDGATPIATFTITKMALKATFDATGVSSPAYASDSLLVRWDYTNDGTFDTDWATRKSTSYTYPADGPYTVAVEVKDPDGRTDSATKYFTIKSTNTNPTPAFTVNLVKGMTASVDASSSSDAEDAPEDLRIRWDWENDGVFDTDWTTAKTAEHLYATAGAYTIKLQVKDLNDVTKSVTQEIVASPITILNSFLTYGSPYKIGLHFRIINNLTGQPVTPADVPALTRGYFTISEDNVPIDMSETNQILYNGKRPMFMVMILDFTGSMYDAGGVTPMVESAKSFIESQGDNTYISLWGFWERQGGDAEIDDYTLCTAAGKAKLQADLDAFVAAYHDRGATEIWDLLKRVLESKFPDYDTGVNRGVVFLSDGHDTTSVTGLNTLIESARTRATCIFSVGLAFRPLEYPDDEPKLKRIADDTGGLYFTVNQVGDLATVFSQLSENVNADWTLSYITLESTGTHIVKVVCNYLDGYATLTGTFPITTGVKGDIKKGLLLVTPAVQSPVNQTEYALYASYIPRNISTFKLKVTSASPVRLTLSETDSICKPSEGWMISPNVAAGEAVPADGWYTMSCATPLEYGSWGNIARCTVDATNLPAVHFELPALVDQATLYGDKAIVFKIGGGITLDVP